MYRSESDTSAGIQSIHLNDSGEVVILLDDRQFIMMSVFEAIEAAKLILLECESMNAEVKRRLDLPASEFRDE